MARGKTRQLTSRTMAEQTVEMPRIRIRSAHSEIETKRRLTPASDQILTIRTPNIFRLFDSYNEILGD